MGFLAGGVANVVGQASGLGKSAGVLQELTGQPGRVQILQPGLGCVLQLDACVNEQHGREVQVTTNPIEDGGVVSDHIIVNPVNLAITGVISDTPLYDGNRFLTQSIGNVATALIPPLGVVALATAYQLAHPQDAAFSRSAEAYRVLMRLVAGDQTASPAQPPTPVTVLTKYARYPDMVIKSLAIPRDASTNGQLVFTMQLEQIQVVTAQYVAVAVLNPRLSGGKKSLGEQEAQGAELLKNLNSGESLSYSGTKAVLKPIVGAADKIANFAGY